MALGLLHGPAELLPVSSSAHTTLVPWLLGWPYGELEDPALRKSFEVALHAGTATALLRRPGGIGVGGRPSFLIPAVAPAALAGYAFAEKIERRLGTPGTIAAGLIAGSVAMGGAEMFARLTTPRARVRGERLTPRTRARVTPFRSTTPPLAVAGETPAAADTGADAGAGEAPTATDAGARDGLALGVAQAVALIPGVSRSGATIATARVRGFSRRDSDRVSWQVGLPVIAGATLLKGARLAREGVPGELALPLAGGAASAFASTLVSAKLLGPRRRAALLPACVIYRCVLATLVVRRMRDNTGKYDATVKK